MEFTTTTAGAAAACAAAEITARLEDCRALTGKVRPAARAQRALCLPQIAQKYGLSPSAVNRLRIAAEDALHTLEALD